MSHHSSHLPSRRAVLQRLGAAGAVGPTLGAMGLNLAAMGQARATSGDYKALVCVFLYGGNDAYNTVLATDTPSWNAYMAARADIALAPAGSAAATGGSASFHAKLGGVIRLSGDSQARQLAVHPCLSEVASMYGNGRLALLANVGPLIQPLTKSEYGQIGVPRPARLYSHNDQQSTWQSMSPEGATRGWGGLMADQLMAGNRPIYAAISASGNAVWLAGQQARAYQLAPTGAIRAGGDGNTLFDSTVARQKLLSVMRTAREDRVVTREQVGVSARSIDAQTELGAAMPSAALAPWGTPGSGPDHVDPLLKYRDPETGAMLLNPLAQQLQAVSRMIAARHTLGMTRQVFFVSLNDFDTHSGQAVRHASGLAKLSHALAYFDRVMTSMGTDQSVTTFTASDFGRDFASNGEGSDHGWGGHHMIMGGAVRGGQLYGRFPTYGTADGLGSFNSPDQLAGGALLPTTSTDAYAATLGRWFGLTAAQLSTLFPNLSHWTSSARDLGFMA